MKKVSLFLGIVIFFASCSKILEGAFKNVAVDKITITGKVVDENSNPIKNCRVLVIERQIFYPQITKEYVETNGSGEFILDFSPRQEEDFLGSYSLKVEKRNYNSTNEYYDIDKTKSKQHFDVFMQVVD